uniref:PXA domain-containing protein n=1 Tax=Heterorhabditis bacteriophora TaxID=37862 RepID=A0A1I7XPK4_HETBA
MSYSIYFLRFTILRSPSDSYQVNLMTKSARTKSKPGNKVDLLPPDAQCGYLKRFKQAVEKALEDAEFREQFMTLFNAFLQSDLCKVRAVDLIQRATTSVWPGTTISLLKFPVMKPSPYRLEMRRRRMLKHRAWIKKEMYARKLMLQETGDSKYAVLTGTIQNTYKDQDDELQPISTSKLSLDEHDSCRKGTKKSWSMDDSIFSKGIWCYDTPGTVNAEQVSMVNTIVLNLFTLDELIRVVPRRLLQPRTALVPVGYSILIGGVAKIDVLSSTRESNIYLTTFVSEDLPLNIMKSEDVEIFLAKYLGTEILAVPCGGPERLKQWPAMESQEFDIQGNKASQIASVTSWWARSHYSTSNAALCCRVTREKNTRLSILQDDHLVFIMNYCTLERWFHDPRSWWIAGLGISIALLTWLGFGAFSISCCISSLFLGFNFAAWVTIDSNGEFLAPLVDYWVNKGNGASTNTLHTTSGTRRTMPWDGLEIPSTVNDSLENLLDQIVDKYVNNWYESGISRDRAFLSEIRYQIRFACSLFARRLLALDLPRIIVQDALPITALHLNRIIKIEDDMEEKRDKNVTIVKKLCVARMSVHQKVNQYGELYNGRVDNRGL